MTSSITNPELFSDLTQVDVNFENFFLFGRPSKVSEKFTIKLTEHTYLPKIAEPRRDWVSSVAVPAFLAHAADNKVETFATIGTGGGLDAVAALEIFDLEKLALTDLHPSVVAAAAGNVRSATAYSADRRVRNAVDNLIALPGDICQPLTNGTHKFDLIYENLPNIPIAATHIIDLGQTSSTYVPIRQETIPEVGTKNLLALHWLALQQARSILSSKGAVLSSIGGRVPLEALIANAGSAGYNASILTYTWKVQSEPEEVIGGYLQNQEAGLGPFYFYPVNVLESTFKELSPAVAGANAHVLEKQLEPHRLDAAQAYAAHKNGQAVGHTVAIVRSTLKA